MKHVLLSAPDTQSSPPMQKPDQALTALLSTSQGAEEGAGAHML